MKRINFTSVALFIYLVVVGFITWPGRNPHIAYTDYFIMLGATFFIIILLRFVQIQRIKADTEKNKKSVKEKPE